MTNVENKFSTPVGKQLKALEAMVEAGMVNPDGRSAFEMLLPEGKKDWTPKGACALPLSVPPKNAGEAAQWHDFLSGQLRLGRKFPDILRDFEPEPANFPPSGEIFNNPNEVDPSL